MMNVKRLPLYVMALSLLVFSSCASEKFEVLNPFAEEGPGEGYGSRDNSAILEDGGEGAEAEKARHALEVMGSYRQAQAPQPTYPVVQPAEVRLMWVPDHLNKAGDLVPAHYYYLRVLPDRWAVQDAFELEQQLNVTGPGGGAGATPWVYGGGAGGGGGGGRR